MNEEKVLANELRVIMTDEEFLETAKKFEFDKI